MNDRAVVYSSVSSGESHMYTGRCYNVNGKSKELKFYGFNGAGVVSPFRPAVSAISAFLH